MPPRSDADSEFDAMLSAAALAASPLPPSSSPGPNSPDGGNINSRKRQRVDGADGPGPDSDNEEEDDELPIQLTANKNVLGFAKQYATHKCLRPSQVAEVEAFAVDPIVTRQIKLFATLLGVGNCVDTIRTAAPDFKLSSSTDKNLHQLAIGILVSPLLRAYKGSLPTKHLLNIVKKKRFDLPAGIELISSDWAVVKTRAEYHLTQGRAVFKKLLKASVADNPKNHPNIFALGQRFVKDTDSTLTTPLCAQITLMRKYFLLHPGDLFWDKLDDRLAWMRENSGGDTNKQTKMFKVVLDDDRNKHGNKADYSMLDDAVVDEWQSEVDTVVGTAA
ncbi:hypothetical protein DFH07DRAFT_961492 [Mycena maculata]|uniref:Uncharacterized protein n=1 Tax=Mycena maculata TaxID=230809 RepID=A0AAD7ITD7_9AGAR|nr:hypothetical protein DFH07DRAFT_961492 [Mycena maculata]